MAWRSEESFLLPQRRMASASICEVWGALRWVLARCFIIIICYLILIADPRVKSFVSREETKTESYSGMFPCKCLPSDGQVAGQLAWVPDQ